MSSTIVLNIQNASSSSISRSRHDAITPVPWQYLQKASMSLANSTQQNLSWEAKPHSATPENLLVIEVYYYRVLKKPTTRLTHSQMTTVHTLRSCYFMAHFNTIFPLILRLSMRSFPFRRPSYAHISHLPHARHVISPSHLPLFYQPKNMW
jgi:hypothetical protein